MTTVITKTFKVLLIVIVIILALVIFIVLIRKTATASIQFDLRSLGDVLNV